MLGRSISKVLFFYACGILFLHLAPTGDLSLDPVELGPVRTTHVLHVLLFLPWGIFGIGFVGWTHQGRVRRALLWIGLGLGVAFLAEGIQHWLPYRSFTWVDVGCNMLGVLIGALMLGRCWSTNRRNPSTKVSANAYREGIHQDEDCGDVQRKREGGRLPWKQWHR